MCLLEFPRASDDSRHPQMAQPPSRRPGVLIHAPVEGPARVRVRVRIAVLRSSRTRTRARGHFGSLKIIAAYGKLAQEQGAARLDEKVEWDVSDSCSFNGEKIGGGGRD